MRAKLHSRKGFTLTETLTAVAVLALLALALAAGLPTAMRVYRSVTTQAEASVLCATLSTAVSDELRFSANAGSNPDGAFFDSATFGRKASFSADGEGHITIGGRELLGPAAYTSGLKADIQVTYDGKVFHVDLSVTDGDGNEAASAALDVAPVN